MSNLFFYLIKFDIFFHVRCPPCRGFTPVLVEFYKKYAEEKNFEIIFISSDRDEKSFEEYYEGMPWLTLDYKEREKKSELSSKFDVNGIPTLILLDADSGDIISTDARDQVQKRDKKGEDCPWRSKSTKKPDSGGCFLL